MVEISYPVGATAVTNAYDRYETSKTITIEYRPLVEKELDLCRVTQEDLLEYVTGLTNSYPCLRIGGRKEMHRKAACTPGKAVEFDTLNGFYRSGLNANGRSHLYEGSFHHARDTCEERGRPFTYEELKGFWNEYKTRNDLGRGRKRKSDDSDEGKQEDARHENERKEAVRQAEDEKKKKAEARLKETDSRAGCAAVRKKCKDEETERPRIQRHNTVYLFEVDKTTPPTAQEVVRFAVEHGWHENFEDRTVIKAGVTQKEQPTQREKDCNSKFGVTHTIDRYATLVDDVIKEDVEKLLFVKLEEAGAKRPQWLLPSKEHFFFDHGPGLGEEEIMDLCRRVFCETVAPYVKQQPPVDSSSVLEGSDDC